MIADLAVTNGILMDALNEDAWVKCSIRPSLDTLSMAACISMNILPDFMLKDASTAFKDCFKLLEL